MSNTNQEIPLQQRMLVVAKAILSIFFRRVMVFALALAALVGLSFLFFGQFSFTAFSERLVWTGIGVALIGGILIFGQASGGRGFGLSGGFTGAMANELINFNIEVRKDLQSKFGFTTQLFLIGVMVFIFGVLVERVFK